MEVFNPPQLRSDFVIIANSEEYVLAAQIISYLFNPKEYIPFFSFIPVDVGRDDVPKTPDIYAIQRRRAENFSVLVNNALAENKGCETLIYVGLSSCQRSYLNFDKYFDVLEINDEADVRTYLDGFGYHKDTVLTCSETQVTIGLVIALKQNRILQIGVHNEELDLPIESGEIGAVIIEIENNLTGIIAIAYACSISASIFFVDKLEDDEEHDVLYLLERWSHNESGALAKLKKKITSRLNPINYSAFQFLTFFTAGLPYSLCVQAIPVSHVNMDYRPDFFIFNAILNETNKLSGSAVIFSTQSFNDEETPKLTSLLEFENFYQRRLIGNGATSYNLKNTIERYPFDLLHICGHGGSINGTYCSVQFQDKEGKSHIIEFDHVLCISLTPYEDMHCVESIYYFRKFNGFIWKSRALKEQGYHKELYASIEKEISKAFTKKKVKVLKHLDNVINTNVTKCTDFHYQGIFDQIASHECHPFIFNNSCWSWMTISTNFLTSGARGYLGTLRDIKNDLAVKFSLEFYENVFSNQSIVQAINHATKSTIKESDENLFLFWGLHFSTLKNVNPVKSSKERVLRNLGSSLGLWNRKLQSGIGGDPELVKGNIKDINWLLRDVVGTDNEHMPKL